MSSTRLSPRRPLAVGLILAAACASSPNSRATAASAASAAGPDRNTTKSSARANLLTAEDIQNSHIPNVFDLVSALRPRWLQTRGTDSFQKPTEIQVYLGSTRMQGGLNALRELSSLGVSKIEWVDGITASARWGLDHGAGAIVVSTSPR